jgi:hypothetical protein
MSTAVELTGIRVAILDEFNIFPHLQPELFARLPLLDIEWLIPNHLTHLSGAHRSPGQ